MLCLRTKKPSDPNSFNETGCRGGTDNLCITKLFLRSCAFGFLTKNTLGPPLSWRWCLLPRPSQCSGGFNVFVRCFRKVALSFTWHGLETWRPKPPAGKMVLINHQPTISPGGWDCLCPPPPAPQPSWTITCLRVGSHWSSPTSPASPTAFHPVPEVS